MADRAAILIVNGGRDPAAGRWLELCLEQVARHTTRPDTRIWVWNNNVADDAVPEIVGRHPDATLVQGDPDEPLAHPHAVPLQRLYERAREEASWIVTLDSDAFPVRAGWLENLIEHSVEPGLGGVWRDELRRGVLPYVHASCLCAHVDFIEGHGLRLDHVSTSRHAHRLDTLGLFTRVARERGITPYKLRRSNRREIHRLIGGIYGDWVYHHGAGSRVGVGFWDERSDEERAAVQRRVRDRAAELLFHQPERYLAWLRGEGASPPSFVFVLGMHRSGTSCLAGSLERCGVHLGEVSRANPYNRKGNHELAAVVTLNDAILKDAGGTWEDPPGRVSPSAARRAEIASVLGGLRERRPAGLKDPRVVLAAWAWLDAAPDALLVGSFRHPRSVTDSLARRSGMREERAHALWVRYNRDLLALACRRDLPLIEFDLSDVDRYRRCVLHAAYLLDLRPDLQALGEFITPELDAARGGADAAPDPCRTLLDELRGRALPPEPEDAFAAAIVDIWACQASLASPTPVEPAPPPSTSPPRPSRRLPRLLRWRPWT